MNTVYLQITEANCIVTEGLEEEVKAKQDSKQETMCCSYKRIVTSE